MSVGGLMGAVGGVAFGFGLLSLLLAIFQPLMPAALVYGNLTVGFLLLAGAATFSFDALRERLASGAGRRASVHGTSAILSAVLGLVLLGLLAFLSTRYTERFDWTEQRVNTLSQQTLDLLAGLESDVVLTAFFREQDSTLARDLLERYAYTSDLVSVRFVDPNRRPDLIEAHEIDVSALSRGLLLVERGDDTVAVAVRQIDEAEVTNAILKLTSQGGRKVYFLDGHNERVIGSGEEPQPESGFDEDVESAHSRAGFGRVAAALRNETHTVESLLLATAGDVPEDADALVIAGPTRPFLAEERQALERYLARGGAMLVMLDPRAQTNLYEDLLRWGIDVGDDVIVDPVMSVNRQPTAPVAEQYGPEGQTHAIGENLERTIFSMARSVSPRRDAADASEGIGGVVYTSESSWAERGIADWMKTGNAMKDESDVSGPLSIAVAGRPHVPLEGDAVDPPRIVVVGDSNFATNELFDVFSNRDLLLNSVSWLLGDVEHITVRPNVARSSSLALTGGQLQAIQYLSLLVLPEGIALLGVLTWWLRRRARES
jgi:ABC-type uncharacterized transport system involved in gliding motility auxiliary subunit